jgi:hypothetical protein
MSDDKHSWTIRLTPEDQVALQALCHFYKMNRPDAVRRAMREALVAARRKADVGQKIPLSGSFMPLSSDMKAVFPVQLKRKVADE